MTALGPFTFVILYLMMETMHIFETAQQGLQNEMTIKLFIMCQIVCALT